MITPLSENQKPYKLSDEIHYQIYNNIRDVYLFDKEKPLEKIAIFLAGQPGSGKTTLRNSIYQDYDTRFIVEINTDDIRNFHPKYKDLQKDPDNYKRAGWLVNPDSVSWASNLSEDAIKREYSVLYDMTFAGNVDIYQNMMKNNRESGYKNELHVLAVNPEISRLGTHLRYENQLKDKGVGRAVSIISHDANFNNLNGNIKSAIESGLVDRVCIYSRMIFRDHSGEIKNNAVERLYDSNIEGFDTRKMIDVVKKEHTRPFNGLEKEYLSNKYDQAKELISQRNGDLLEFTSNLKGLKEKLENGKDNGHHL